MPEISFSKSLKTLLIPVLLCLPFLSRATHILAGEITFRSLSYLSYQATVTIYTDATSTIPTDTISLRWGDGSTEIVQGVGQTLPNQILKTTYVSNVHTYSGPKQFYVIRVRHVNRINNIINILGGASDELALYLEDTLRLYDPVLTGSNSSPVLLSFPIDYANLNDTFYHNPIAFDPDGDSLAFKLITPLENIGANVPGYRYPDQVTPGPMNQFTINPRTGEILWATPKFPGTYNIAILVTSYRGNVNMGTLIRDMQIRVGELNNNPPQIAEFADTCVVAGTMLTRLVSARDDSAAQFVTLSAEGGPMRMAVSPATFATTSGNPVTSVFRWQTECAHIRRQPYQVVFKAQDSHVRPLVDLKTWIIKIVAPAPENLQAQVAGKDINLSWNEPYACDTIPQFMGFSVWRREGSNPFPVENCETGLAGKGYIKIASGITDYAYADRTAEPGKQYCYRLLAEFAERTAAGNLFYNKVESLPSNEICAELKIDAPLMKNVSVTVTDATAGKIYVAWYRPKTDAANLDTTQLSGTYSYKLYRSAAGGAFTPIATYSNQYFANLVDTAFTDSLLNTVTNSYAYKVEFYANDTLLIGASDTASSVYLSITPFSNKLELAWQEDVPWQNFSYVVYKKNGLAFDSIATVSVSSFTDTEVVNETQYCYYVKTLGEYSSAVVNDTLVNLSQQVCAKPTDLDPPCAVLLEVTSPCAGDNPKNICSEEELPGNELGWQAPAAGCASDIASYNLYYSAHEQEALTKVAATAEIYFLHGGENSLAGCYAVAAVDSAGNESPLSNIVCVGNCPCYVLPNVFTPNGDLRNDYYTPIKPYRFVEKINMKIYNRWGTLVFETTDPEIDWDGRDINNGKEVKEGVYYYVCEVFETKAESGAHATVLNGYIHVIRGREASVN